MGLCLSHVVAMIFLSHLETTKILSRKVVFNSGKMIFIPDETHSHLSIFLLEICYIFPILPMRLVVFPHGPNTFQIPF